MTRHKVRVVQVFKAQREIVIDVDSSDDEGLEGALEQVMSGSVDVPDFDDPRWVTGWDLQNEEVFPA